MTLTAPSPRAISGSHLDPWGGGPPADLIRLVAPATWREHAALPVGIEGGALTIAAVGRAHPALIDELRSVSYREVRVAAAPGDHVQLWLEVGIDGRPWEEAVTALLARTISALGLHARTDARLPEAPGRVTPVADVAAAFELSEATAVEVLALCARMPQARLERYVVGAHLAHVLPAVTAEALRVVPLMIRPGLAVIATPAALGAASRARLEEALGVSLRVALCTPSSFKFAFEAVYSGAEEIRRVAADDEVYAALASMGLLGSGREDGLERLSAMTGESRVTAVVRLGYATPLDVRRATASVLGMDVSAGETLDLPLAERASPVLWRRWGCIPLRMSGKEAFVASDAPLSPARREAVRRVLGAAEVTTIYYSLDEVWGWLDSLPAALSEPADPEDVLLGAGMITADELAQAKRRAARGHGDTGLALIEQKSASAEDVVEARAIAANVPWIHADRYAPDPDATDALPGSAARASRAVPLRRAGRCLVVAFVDSLRDARPLEVASELAVLPVLATAADAEALLARFYAARVDVPAAYQQLARVLVGRQVLARSRVEAAMEAFSRGRSLDLVLAGRDMLSAEALAALLAEHAGTTVIDLEVRRRMRTVVDGLGRERTTEVLDDPVDIPTARRLPRDLAERHSMLAVSVEPNGTTLLAMVDPLDEAGLAAAHSALAGPVRVAVTTRRDLSIAQRRAYARPSLGERLEAAGIVSRPQLDRAIELHDRAGVRLGSALVSLGYVTEAELAAAIADQARLPFVSGGDLRLDVDIARRLPHAEARSRGVCPLHADGSGVVIACTDVPASAERQELRTLLGAPVRPVIVTQTALDDLLQRVWRDEYVHISATELLSRTPEDSARWVLSRGQKIFFLGLIALTLIGLVVSAVHTVTAFVAVSTFFYVGFSAYKFYLAYRAVGTTLEIETTPEDLAALDDRDLPIYTILVPVYREARVFPILARAIERLDYPAAKLDVKILLEEDDAETIEVARRSKLPSSFHLLVVPHGQPKGKPKACNYGLIHAKGEYVVIFDAEDIPEPDQLKKAIVAFRKGDERLACVQAKLNYFNRDQNLLTRWFTTEYSMWFDLFLPGLDASGAPIPLGGTSNHFRTSQLRALGAWDPHNVTEDADLGMRLYKRGWTTAVIDSTTFEEANSELYNWIRQRSRWVKGYIQTYLVHMRNPWKLYRQIGLRGFLSFQFVVGGTFFGYLVNPIYWLLTATWFLFHWGIIREIFPAPVFYIGAVGLYLGNFAFTYLNVAGCLRREYYDMVKYALLSPVYWAFMSVAAWKGFLQLFYKPSYWEKTDHGLYRGEIRVKLRGAVATVGGRES